MVRASITVMGATVVEGNLAKHRLRAENPMPAFALLAGRFLEIEKLQFDSMGASTGSPWSPLAFSTLMEKLRLGYDPRILHRTTLMRESLTNADAPGHVRRITPEVLELGTSVTSDAGYSYPTAHQEGRGVPQRKPVNITDHEAGIWARTVHRYIVHGELSLGTAARAV